MVTTAPPAIHPSRGSSNQSSLRARMKHRSNTTASTKVKDGPSQPKPKPKPNPPAWSLPLVITVPLSLVSAIIYLFGSGPKYVALNKPIWFPSLSVIHVGSVGSTLLMSLAAWLVWAHGGFSLDSDPLPLYLAQVSLSIVWDPLLLTMGLPSVAFAFCLVHLWTVALCLWMFGQVNSYSRHFVVPCLAWAIYLTAVTFQLIYF